MDSSHNRSSDPTATEFFHPKNWKYHEKFVDHPVTVTLKMDGTQVRFEVDTIVRDVKSHNNHSIWDGDVRDADITFQNMSLTSFFTTHYDGLVRLAKEIGPYRCYMDTACPGTVPVLGN